MSQMCNLKNSGVLTKPQIWGQAVLSQLNDSKIDTSHIQQNVRYLYPTLLNNGIFTNLVR